MTHWTSPTLDMQQVDGCYSSQNSLHSSNASVFLRRDPKKVPHNFGFMSAEDEDAPHSWKVRIEATAVWQWFTTQTCNADLRVGTELTFPSLILSKKAMCRMP